LILDLITFAVTFVIALVLYPPLIRFLRRMKAGQVIQEELPDSHQKKAGTPTAGGVLFAVIGIVAGVLANSRALAARLGAIEGLELLTDGAELPIVALRATDPAAVDLVVLSHLLRERGWIVPAYTLPPNAEHITVLRMVVKENFSRDMVDMLAQDVVKAMHALARVHPSLHPGRPRLRPGC